jgi:hypothetical protein
MLSMTERICLIKLVLSSLPLYFMFVYPMSNDIINVISSINCFFLWSGCSTSHEIFKVAWHKVIKSKSLGGLDLGFLYHKILALLFKWDWNLDNEVARGWQKFILRKYQPNLANELHVFVGSLSSTWCGIVLAFSTSESIAIPLKPSIGFKVGDGSNIRFWTDSWLGTPASLQNLFPRLFNLSLQQSVSLIDVYSLDDYSISLTWRRNLRYRHLFPRPFSGWPGIFFSMLLFFIFSSNIF